MSDARTKQLRHWESVAGGWHDWFEWTVRNFAPLTEWFAANGVWPSGARVLDVACGSGYPALMGAARVGITGRIVAIDIASGMVARVSRRAAGMNVTNVELVEGDAESLPFGDEAFDAVTNAYGLMFADDVSRAVGEARRVLKPGGRFAVATWDDPAASSFFTAIGNVAADVLSLPQPVSGGPGPFRLASSVMLAAQLGAAGFSHVLIERKPMTFDLASADEYCRIFTDLAWRSQIEARSSADLRRFTSAVAEAVRPFAAGGRLRFVASSVCAVGSR